jgi:membrane associated rhomboid family serine protease
LLNPGVATVFPFIDTAPRASRPVVVLGLIAANVLVFLWMRSLPPRMLEATLVHYALIPVRFTDPQLALAVGLDPGNWLPMLTDMFLHGGWMHLIFNMWFLWIFGPAMEARFGRPGFLALYVIGGIVANIVHLATHLESTEPVIGASGAVAAVIAAYAVTCPWARVLTIVPLGFIPLLMPVPAFLFAMCGSAFRCCREARNSLRRQWPRRWRGGPISAASCSVHWSPCSRSTPRHRSHCRPECGGMPVAGGCRM